MAEISEHVLTTDRHTTAYLRAGADDAPLVVLVHGWPERAISWRHQIGHLADLGLLVVAPDMRGYGGSSAPGSPGDYALEHVVDDMLELLGHLGRTSAVWVGHDWGSPVVWSLASHHAPRCEAVASLCVPYQPGGFTLDNLLPLVDRDIYPETEFPAGQWEYFLYYREHFAEATATFDADVRSTVKVLFRSGSPSSVGRPSNTAYTRVRGGWFGTARRAPDRPMDDAVLDPQSLEVYVDGLTRNGFSGPDSWYVNDEANGAYARASAEGGRLTMPVLFVHARYDMVCETVLSRLADPMRAACADLTEVVVDSGHWVMQEQPAAVNEALTTWLAAVRAR